MPVLSNPRHETFAQALAKGKSQTEAYEIAGYKGDRRAASRLATNVDIQARVAELQQRVAERVIEKTAVTRADILGEISKLALAPIGHEHVRPADKRAACMDYAKIEGWVVDKHEHGAPGDFADLDRMTPDELRDYLASEIEALALRGEEAGKDNSRSRPGTREGTARGQLN